MVEKVHHWHGCTNCGTAYDDACKERDEDALCTDCRGGKAWWFLIRSRAPRDCCYGHSRQVAKEEKARYQLAGKVRWYQCGLCFRCHATKPVRPGEE